jgi:hypothetical protein
MILICHVQRFLSATEVSALACLPRACSFRMKKPVDPMPPVQGLEPAGGVGAGNSTIE